jgi:hypothetical protein
MTSPHQENNHIRVNAFPYPPDPLYDAAVSIQPNPLACGFGSYGGRVATRNHVRIGSGGRCRAHARIASAAQAVRVRRACRASQRTPGLALACPKHGAAGVGPRQRWIEHGPLRKRGSVSPPGFVRSKPKTPRAGRRVLTGTCGDQLSCAHLSAHEAVGTGSPRRSAPPLSGRSSGNADASGAPDLGCSRDRELLVAQVGWSRLALRCGNDDGCLKIESVSQPGRFIRLNRLAISRPATLG